MLIGITDTMTTEDKFNHYVDWLEKSGNSLRWMKLSYKLDNFLEIDKCHALILTGGNDVDPQLYNGQRHHPKIIGVDKNRDDFERKLLAHVLKNRMPVLAICRGLQLVNVHFGGTLIADVEEAGYKSHRSNGEIENNHSITVEQNSSLFEITSSNSGKVNSSHHQAVDKPGKGLKITARFDDGIIEAMEFEEKKDSEFFQLLQWHPERLKDHDNPFRKNILDEFLKTTLEFSTINY